METESIKFSAIAVEELLHRSKRRMVILLCLPQQFELRAEFIVQRVGAVSPDRQTAALLRAIFGKGPHDHKAAWLDPMSHCHEVTSPICGIGQKMEYGAVMPEIEAVLWKHHLSDVRLQPIYGTGCVTYTMTRHIERGGRDIENAQVAVACRQQIVHQGRRATADIDDRSIEGNTRLTNQREGVVCMLLVPTHRVGRLVGVNGLPVGLILHRFSPCLACPLTSSSLAILLVLPCACVTR